jgi:hypothetical protein
VAQEPARGTLTCVEPPLDAQAVAFVSFVLTATLVVLGLRFVTAPFLRRLRAGILAHSLEEEAPARLAALGLTGTTSEELRRRSRWPERFRWASDGTLVALGTTFLVLDVSTGAYAGLLLDVPVLLLGLGDGVLEQVRFTRRERTVRTAQGRGQ